MSPKISIVTPSYNQGQFIGDTIRSILAQNYSNLEYIVIDGGSSDNSVDVIKSFEKDISYWVSEKDRGQADAINKGFRKATGNIVTWINSDDLLVAGALHKVATYFESLPPTTGVVHGYVELFKENTLVSLETLYGKPCFERYVSGMTFSQPGAFFRRSCLNEVGLLNEALHYGMDYELFARLSCVCDFKPVADLFAKYRLHEESKTVADGDKFRADWNKAFFSLCHYLGWNDVIDEVQDFLPSLRGTPILPVNYRFVTRQDILDKADKRKVVFYFLLDLLKHYYWYDDRKAARALLKKMKVAFPRQWFADDARAQKIIQKLQLPEPALQLLKSIKRFTGSS